MSPFIEIDEHYKEEYNQSVTHPLQSFEWGEFRKKTGIQISRRGILKKERLVNSFSLSLHPIPYTKLTIGYLPKSDNPNKELLKELESLSRHFNTIFVQLEPNILKNDAPLALYSTLKNAAHPLFTKYTFLLDITKSEDELLAQMHQKTRYNIKIAQKHNVQVNEDNSQKAFNEYLRLTNETTIRQKFYAHSTSYHKIQWEILKHTPSENELTSHLLIATYNTVCLVAWIVFVFKDTLYYPYGASSNLHKNVMASNLMMWEAIKFGKKLGLKKFDMWGALGPNPSEDDPWFGFHQFKQRYGATLIEQVGSFDLVINPLLYCGYVVTDKLRWVFLRLRK